MGTHLDATSLTSHRQNIRRRETGPAWVNGKSMTMSMDEKASDYVWPARAGCCFDRKDGGSWAEAARARSAPTQQAWVVVRHIACYTLRKVLCKF